MPSRAFDIGPDRVRRGSLTPRPGRDPRVRPKILLYSHDTFGMGNIRRTLLLAEEARRTYPGGAALILTGSPVIHAMRIPEGVDYVKLPCLDRVEPDHYEPRYLTACSREVDELRRTILLNAVLGFRPDLMIVDKRPGGIRGELVETLRELHRLPHRPRLVLGVRDILDRPAKTVRSLKKSRCFELIEKFYDEVWVYGVPEVFDAVRSYRFPPAVAAKTRYCGYLRRPTPPRTGGDGVLRVLVTTGGGGDGAEVIRAYLAGLGELPRRVRIRSTVVFGPQMPSSERDEILARYGDLPDVEIHDFEPHIERRYAAAAVVVSMAGYNTVCELLSQRVPAVLVPRAEPVQEQLIRARRLARMGYFSMISPDELTPRALMQKVLLAAEGGFPDERTLDLGGLDRIRERMAELLVEAAR